MEKRFFVYILASAKHGTLYVGVTSDLVKRVHQHKLKVAAGFTQRYGVDKLVYYEIFEDATNALQREKQLKKWHRTWKIELVEQHNPGWVDLGIGLS